MNALIEIDTKELGKEIVSVVDQANAIVISSPEHEQEAFNLRRTAKFFQIKVKAFWEPHKKRADDVHAGLCADEKKMLTPAVEVVAILDKKLAYYDEQRRQEAERVRREAEVLARKLAEDKALAEAEALERAGEHKEAAAVIAEPVNVPIQTIPKPAKIEGGSFRTVYFGIVKDKAAFIKAAAFQPGLQSLLEIPQGSLDKFAAATKSVMGVPGLEFGSRRIPIGR